MGWHPWHPMLQRNPTRTGQELQSRSVAWGVQGQAQLQLEAATGLTTRLNGSHSSSSGIQLQQNSCSLQGQLHLDIYIYNIYIYIKIPPHLPSSPFFQLVHLNSRHSDLGSQSKTGFSPSSPLRFVPWKAFLSRENFGYFSPRRLLIASNGVAQLPFQLETAWITPVLLWGSCPITGDHIKWYLCTVYTKTYVFRFFH